MTPNTEVPTPLRRDKHSADPEVIANPAPTPLRRDADEECQQQPKQEEPRDPKGAAKHPWTI